MKPGYLSTEFWLIASWLAFAMWIVNGAVADTSIELDRVVALLGLVAAPVAYYFQQRTNLKKDIHDEK